MLNNTFLNNQNQQEKTISEKYYAQFYYINTTNNNTFLDDQNQQEKTISEKYYAQ